MNDIGKDLQDAFDDGHRRVMKADKEIRILAQLLEAKTELQEKALTGGRGSLIRKETRLEIKGIDKGIEIVKKEIGKDDRKAMGDVRKCKVRGVQLRKRIRQA